jgi:hypothetical protein
MFGRCAALPLALLLCALACGCARPAHKFVFNQHTSYEGEPAFEFVRDDGNRCIVLCNGILKDRSEFEGETECLEVEPYLHRTLPPTFQTGDPDRPEHEYLEIPEMNRQFVVRKVYR